MSKPGVFYADCDERGLMEPRGAGVESAIRSARSASDVVIVAAHVGPNWGEPSAGMRALARQIIELGADCYWGHSNHTPLGIEIHRGKPILFSTGDFVDDYAVDPWERNDLSFFFLLDWEPGGWRLTLTPTKSEGLQAKRAFGKEAEFVMERMEKRSADFGTQLRRDNGRLVAEAKF